MLAHMESQKYSLDLLSPEQTVVENRRLIWADPGQVKLEYASYVTGIRHGQTHRYWRWQTDRAVRIFRTKKGRISGSISTSRPKRSWAYIPFREMDDIPMFRELANEYVGDVNFDKIFPLAKHYAISYQNTLPPGFAMALRQNSLRDMVEVLFGKTRYRKDLAKAVAQSFPQAIMMGVDFRGLVPIDWIIDFLRNNRRVLSYPVKYPSVRNILLRLDRRSYPALLREQLDWATLLHVRDVTSGCNQYGVEVPPQRIRSWEQFHNLIWQQIRDNETSLSSIVPKDAPIPLTDLAQQLSGLTVDGYTVVVPERAEELYVWGHEMRNCIGGYAKLVLHEGSKETLGAITSNGRVVVNFEVHDGKLRQFLGKCNQDPPVEIAKKFEPVFQSLGVSTNSYLGKPR